MTILESEKSNEGSVSDFNVGEQKLEFLVVELILGILDDHHTMGAGQTLFYDQLKFTIGIFMAFFASLDEVMHMIN